MTQPSSYFRPDARVFSFAAFVVKPVGFRLTSVIVCLCRYGQAGDAHHITQPPADGAGAAAAMEVGLSLPGVRLVSWAVVAVINWCFDCKITR
jgi:hypothetical protein